MIEFVIRRLLAGVVVLYVLSTVLFFVMRAVPGDVVRLQLADAGSVTPERMAEIEDQLGLDEPVLSQYVTWLGNIVRGDFGESLWERRPVTEMIGERLPVTIELAVLAIIIAVSMGLLIGIASAIKRGTATDSLLRVTSVVGLSVPNFFVALLFITFLSLWFNYVTPLGYEALWNDPWKNMQQMIWPAIALGVSVAAAIARLTRSSMLEVLHADYIRTVRAKGASRTADQLQARPAQLADPHHHVDRAAVRRPARRHRDPGVDLQPARDRRARVPRRAAARLPRDPGVRAALRDDLRVREHRGRHHLRVDRSPDQALLR